MRKIIYLIVVLCFLTANNLRAQWVAQEKNDLYGYVDPASGKVMIPYQYPFVFTDTLTNMALVAVEDRVIGIDKNNNELFTVFMYDGGTDAPQEGVFRIIDNETKKMGFANENGEIVIAPAYDFVIYFSDGLAAVNQGGQKYWFEDGHYTFSGGKWGYIDHQGNLVFPLIFDDASAFYDRKAEVSIGRRSFTIEADQ